MNRALFENIVKYSKLAFTFIISLSDFLSFISGMLRTFT